MGVAMTEAGRIRDQHHEGGPGCSGQGWMGEGVRAPAEHQPIPRWVGLRVVHICLDSPSEPGLGCAGLLASQLHGSSQRREALDRDGIEQVLSVLEVPIGGRMAHPDTAGQLPNTQPFRAGLLNDGEALTQQRLSEVTVVVRSIFLRNSMQ